MSDYHEPGIGVVQDLPARPIKPQKRNNIEDLSHIEEQKQRLRQVQEMRSTARKELDKDRRNRVKYQTYQQLDKEYNLLLAQLS